MDEITAILLERKLNRLQYKKRCRVGVLKRLHANGQEPSILTKPEYQALVDTFDLAAEVVSIDAIKWQSAGIVSADSIRWKFNVKAINVGSYEESRETEDCWNCGGEGYSHHDCGEDTCCCLDNSPNVVCGECKGKGVFPERHWTEHEWIITLER